HFLNSAAYLFLPMLAGVSVDRRQCHHRFNPNISIGEDLVTLSDLFPCFANYLLLVHSRLRYFLFYPFFHFR
ncbi:MAG: hypothetical protein RSC68_29975, partial [Acinetobacter sp.]